MARSSPTEPSSPTKTSIQSTSGKSFFLALIVVFGLLSLTLFSLGKDLQKVFDQNLNRNTNDISEAIITLMKTEQAFGQDEASLKRAKQSVLSFIGSLRLPKEAFWVAETDGAFLYYQGHDELVGKPIDALRGPDGKAYYHDLALMAIKNRQASLTMSTPTERANTFDDHILEALYFQPWNWVIGTTRSQTDTPTKALPLTLFYGVVTACLILIICIPYLLQRRYLNKVLINIGNIFRAVAYAQPIPTLLLNRKSADYRALGGSYDLLVESDRLRNSGYSRANSAQNSPVIQSVLDATALLDKLVYELLEAGKHISEANFDETMTRLDQAIDQVSLSEQSVRETIQQAHKLEVDVNEPLSLIRDRTGEAQMARKASEDIQDLAINLDRLVERLQAASVRFNVDILGSVWTALKGQKQRIAGPLGADETRARIDSFMQELRDLTLGFEQDIEVLKQRLSSSLEALVNYDNLVSVCEMNLENLRGTLQIMPESLISVVQSYNVTGEALVAIRAQVEKISVIPNEAANTGFTRDTLAIAQQARKAREEIEKSLRFGKR